jgi:TPR repeat protein
MKKQLCLAILANMLFLVCSARAAATYFPLPHDDGRAAAETSRRKAAVSAGYARKAGRDASEMQKQEALAREPWRVVNGVTNSVFGEGWYHFYGCARKVSPEGILVEGAISSIKDGSSKSQVFFVINFPYVVADGENIDQYQFFMAKAAGTVTMDVPRSSGVPVPRSSGVTTASTIHKYDYGEVSGPPPEWIAAAKAKVIKANDAVLKLDQEKAAEGSALYQYRLGMRYLTGNGIEENEVKAREYFTKAAAQGNEDAAAELRKLSPQ